MFGFPLTTPRRILCLFRFGKQVVENFGSRPDGLRRALFDRLSQALRRRFHRCSQGIASVSRKRAGSLFERCKARILGGGKLGIDAFLSRAAWSCEDTSGWRTYATNNSP